ncbi:hypothetical protein MKX03_009390 [Papaver bracteatum]|nr:hypothetical protein MKX03_009390 [Papaver bracteatum]
MGFHKLSLKRSQSSQSPLPVAKKPKKVFSYFPTCSSADVRNCQLNAAEIKFRERESRLKAVIIELKQYGVEASSKNSIFGNRIQGLETENQRVMKELERLKMKINEERNEKEKVVKDLEIKISELKTKICEGSKQKTINSPPPSPPSPPPTMIKNTSFPDPPPLPPPMGKKPPPPPPSPLPMAKIKNLVPPPPLLAPPPPPPPPLVRNKLPFPPQPPLLSIGLRRVPEVIQLYNTLMRRKDSVKKSGGLDIAPTNTRQMIGEIENKSSHLLAIKCDVANRGDFIRNLIKQVENADFAKIEDVVAFVKWLDDELSTLVDERAVLKHFDWPEKKEDALREAAFAYCDLKRMLELEASNFIDNVGLPCGAALKKMQTSLEKLENGAYNLSRMRESSTNRYKGFHIPTDWMLETGILRQIKLASVKLAAKFMNTVSTELKAAGGAPDFEELMLQGVKFAFRVHQFAGGFDAETTSAFQELRGISK